MGLLAPREMYFIYNVFPLKWLWKSRSSWSLYFAYHLQLQASQSSQVKYDLSGEVHHKKTWDFLQMPEGVKKFNSAN